MPNVRRCRFIWRRRGDGCRWNYFTKRSHFYKKACRKIDCSEKGGGGKELAFFIKQAQDCGVKLYVCQPSLDLHALKFEDLIDGVEMIGGAAFNDMALNADAVIAF